MAFCTKCGKEFTGSFCSNCGNAVNGTQSQSQVAYQTQRPVTEQKLNVMALVGFILGCVSLFLNFWGIVGILALVFSIVGLTQINNMGGKGKGFAVTGIILGAIGVVWGVIALFLMM